MCDIGRARLLVSLLPLLLLLLGMGDDGADEEDAANVVAAAELFVLLLLLLLLSVDFLVLVLPIQTPMRMSFSYAGAVVVASDVVDGANSKGAHIITPATKVKNCL